MRITNAMRNRIQNVVNEKRHAAIEETRKDTIAKQEEFDKAWQKILDEANEKAVKEAELEKRSYSVRLERIELREESARKNIDRLSELKSLDSAYNLVMKEAEKRLADIVSSADFSRILISWIAEAAIGLDRKEAKVSFSEKAPVDEGMLREAEKLVKEETGADVSLSLDSSRVSSPGVILTSIDGKVSYNNQLDVRMRRYSRDIRRIIQEENAGQNSRKS